MACNGESDCLVSRVSFCQSNVILTTALKLLSVPTGSLPLWYLNAAHASLMFIGELTQRRLVHNNINNGYEIILDWVCIALFNCHFHLSECLKEKWWNQNHFCISKGVASTHKHMLQLFFVIVNMKKVLAYIEMYSALKDLFSSMQTADLIVPPQWGFYSLAWQTNTKKPPWRVYYSITSF